MLLSPARVINTYLNTLETAWLHPLNLCFGTQTLSWFLDVSQTQISEYIFSVACFTSSAVWH